MLSAVWNSTLVLFSQISHAWFGIMPPKRQGERLHNLRSSKRVDYSETETDDEFEEEDGGEVVEAVEEVEEVEEAEEAEEDEEAEEGEVEEDGIVEGHVDEGYIEVEGVDSHGIGHGGSGGGGGGDDSESEDYSYSEDESDSEDDSDNGDDQGDQGHQGGQGDQDDEVRNDEEPNGRDHTPAVTIDSDEMRLLEWFFNPPVGPPIKIKLLNPRQPIRRFDLESLLGPNYAPVQRAIIPYLGPMELINLKRTSKAFGDINRFVDSSGFDFNKQLGRFVSDPVALRALMARSRSIMSGNITEQFLFRYTDNETIVDINCLTEYYEELRKFFSKEKGFKLVRQDPRYRRPRVREWVKEIPGVGVDWEGKRNIATITVNLQASEQPGEIMEIVCAKGTAELNFFSWNRFYCLYPYPTLQRKQCFLLREDPDEGGFIKNMDEDWGCSVVSRHFDDSLEAYMAYPRRVGDKRTLIIDLDTVGLEKERETDNALDHELTTFRLRPRYDGRDPGRNLDIYEAAALTICHSCINVPFGAMDTDRTPDDEGNHYVRARFNDSVDWLPQVQSYWEKMRQLGLKLGNYAVLEVMKLRPSQRPADYTTPQQIQELSENGPRAFLMFDADGRAIPATYTLRDNEVRRELRLLWDNLIESIEGPDDDDDEDEGKTVIFLFETS